MSKTESTVFIIDDDEAIRSSLSRALGKRGFAVNSFASATTFLSEYDPTQPGCLVLDYGMPGMNGLELQAALIEQGYAVPIIFITGHGGVPESVQAIRAGAIDFLEKPFRTEVLVDRINLALEINATENAQRAKALQAKAKLEMLTSREKEIVDLIVSDPSNTTSKEIARILNISPRTVDHHRAHILAKMQIKSIVELVDITLASKNVGG